MSIHKYFEIILWLKEKCMTSQGSCGSGGLMLTGSHACGPHVKVSLSKSLNFKSCRASSGWEHLRLVISNQHVTPSEVTCATGVWARLWTQIWVVKGNNTSPGQIESIKIHRIFILVYKKVNFFWTNNEKRDICRLQKCCICFVWFCIKHQEKTTLSGDGTQTAFLACLSSINLPVPCELEQ